MEGAFASAGTPAISQVFNGCTFVIHVGSRDEFVDIIHDLVSEGLITPSVAEQLLSEEKAPE